jgi:uncharacterized protein
MSDRDHGWFLTSTGHQFWPATPIPSDIRIDDIAHALSHLCRFGGHSREFYSVAQHSVIVSVNVPAQHRFTALMHDAAEAYLGDVIQPVKRLLPDYHALESKTWIAMCDAFPELPHGIPDCVKEADGRALITERRDVMNPSLGNWSWGAFERFEPFPEIIQPLSPAESKLLFLARFHALSQ